MTSPALRELLQPIVFIRRTLWFALSGAVLLYVVVAWWMSAVWEPAETLPVLETALTAVAAAAALGSIVFRRVAMGEERLRLLASKPLDVPQMVTQPDGHVDAARLEKVQKLEVREQRLFRLAQELFVPFVVALALNESVALYGLVLAFLERRFVVLLPFAAAALLLNLTMFPGETPYPEAAERAVGMG